MIDLILHYLGVITIYELLKLNVNNFCKLFCFVFSKFAIEYQKFNIEHKPIISSVEIANNHEDKILKENNKTHVKFQFDEMTGAYYDLIEEKKLSTVNNDEPKILKENKIPKNHEIPTHLEYMKNILSEFDGNDAFWERNSLSSVNTLETEILKEIETTYIPLEDNIVNKYHNAILNNVNIECKNVDDISNKIKIMQNKRHKL